MANARQQALTRSKAAERRLAKTVGGWRNPAMGEGYPDVETDTHSYQLKYRSDFPLWLEEMWEQARGDGRRVGKTPVLVLEFRKNGGNVVLYVTAAPPT